jgi:FAD/FMN-containing dehydrogenase
LTIGGLGPLSRQYGTALDHVEEVEVVLANGTITRANNQQNSDLFFVGAFPLDLLTQLTFTYQALKGAGASFGIITEFVVHTEPSPENMIQYSYTIE